MANLLVLLIPGWPLLAVVVNGLAGRRVSCALAGRIAVGAVGLSFLCAVAVAAGVTADPAPRNVTAYAWIVGGGLHVDVGFLIDPLTVVMLMVVTGVGLLIHIYSLGYMRGDPGMTRFFVYMNLFMVSMLLLVMGNNFLVLFIGWEGVGLCSYLLIGYAFTRASAAKAATKAFVVNRIGDAGFLLAIFLIFVNFRTLDYANVLGRAGELSAGAATAIALCLLVGAAGKSAQIPLYTWLPDAMEGPTPVSALIHAATMVTAGVYMVVRTHAIYDAAPAALAAVGAVGGLTALYAATIGLAQHDIKRVLAYSTVSQLGYMFLACGVGAYVSAIFHLVTHAFFKALLFLSAGAVIHSLAGEQDIRKMGGLASTIPVTHAVFLVGTLAIAGVPPLAGFWSKDEIMAHAFVHHHYALYVLAALGAFLTSLYMFRLVYLTFYGPSRVAPDAAARIHESPPVMTVPLVILAALAAGGGALGIPPEHGWLHEFLAPVAASPETSPAAGGGVMLMAAAVALALGGWGMAHYLYAAAPGAAGGWAARHAGAHRLLENAYYADAIYDRLVVEPCKRLGRLWDWADRRVIDRAVLGVGRGTDAAGAGATWAETYVIYGGINVVGYANHWAARSWRTLQTGLVNHYAAVIVLGLFLLAHMLLVWQAGTSVVSPEH